MKGAQVSPGGALDWNPVLGRGTGAALIGAGAMGLVFACALFPVPFDPTLPYSDAQSSIVLFWLCAGAVLLSRGLKSVHAERRAKRLRTAYPGENWRWEFDPSLEIPIDKTRPMAWVILAGLVLLISSVPVWVLPAHASGSEFRALLQGVYAILGAGLAAYLLFDALYFRKFGIVYLRLQALPIFLGEQMDVRLTTTRPLGAFTSMRVELICLQEELSPEPRVEYFGSHSRVLKVKELYRDTLFLRPNAQYDPHRPLELAILMPLPDQLGTRLGGDRPRYWVLDIFANAPGVDFEARFRLPIYARPENSLQKK